MKKDEERWKTPEWKTHNVTLKTEHHEYHFNSADLKWSDIEYKTFSACGSPQADSCYSYSRITLSKVDNDLLDSLTGLNKS